MAKSKLISIVEDDEPFRESMRKLMTALGYTVEVFPSARDFPSIPSPRRNRVFGQRRADARHEWC